MSSPRGRSARWPWVLLVGVCVVGVGLWQARPVALRAVTWKTARRFPSVRWITPDSLSDWMLAASRTQPLILDARTPDEFSVSHLPTARRIDPYRPELRMIGTPARDTEVVVYSSVGYRGARVAEWLAGQGYGRVENLTGGVFAWANGGHPVTRSDGPTTLVHPFDARWGRLLKPARRAVAPDEPRRAAAP